MKVSTEKLEHCAVAMTIEEEAAKLSEGMKKAYARLADKVSIPGFRKGKVPAKILEQRLGKAYIVTEAFNVVMPKIVADAIAENNMRPVTRPQVEIITLEEGKDFSFKVSFTNMPEVTLGEYKGLAIKKEVAPVTDEDVAKQLLVFQKRKGKMLDVPADAKVENGDFISLDFEGSVNGEKFEGGTAKDYPLEVGSGSFIPGFEEQLVGLAVDEEKDVHVTFPEDYHGQDVAGKAAVFKCTVRKIRRQELAPLDDELAKGVSKFETLEELRADVRKNLEEMAQRKAEADRNAAAIDKILESMTVEIPPVMIDTRIDALVNELALRVQSQGLEFNSYLEHANTDIVKVREQYKEKAAKDVKTDLMLDAVARKENLELTDEDINKGLLVMSLQFGTSPQEVVKALKEADKYDNFLANQLNQKAAEFIFANLADA